MTDKAEEPRLSEPLFDFSRWIFTLDDKSLVRVEELTKAGWKFAQVQIGDKTVLYPVKVPDKHPQIDIAAPVRSEEPLSVEQWLKNNYPNVDRVIFVAQPSGNRLLLETVLEAYHQAALASRASSEPRPSPVSDWGFSEHITKLPRASAEVRAGAPPPAKRVLGEEAWAEEALQCRTKAQMVTLLRAFLANVRTHDLASSRQAASPAPELVFRYRNYKGKTSTRHVIPARIYFGSTEYYKDEWLLEAFDNDKRDRRTFALRSIINTEAAIPEGEQIALTAEQFAEYCDYQASDWDSYDSPEGKEMSDYWTEVAKLIRRHSKQAIESRASPATAHQSKEGK